MNKAGRKRSKKVGGAVSVLTISMVVFSLLTMTLFTETSYTAAATKLSTPANVHAAAKGKHSIRISWSRVKNAKGYLIYQKTSTRGPWKKIKTIKKSKSSNWTKKQMKSGRTYYYKVKAMKGKQRSASSQTVYVKCGRISPASLKLNKQTLNLISGKTGQLRAKVGPKKAYTKKVKWSSSNNRVARVNSKGIVKAEKAGKAVITAQTLNGYKKSCTIKVTAPVKEQKDYGVFVGLERKDISKLKGYKSVVIDASQFTRQDISRLHSRGQKVYSYLNVGSLETFRPYYAQFSDLALGNYENWPEEKWVDVSSPRWQSFVVKRLAKELADKGVDGYFLDNTDVYYRYQKEKIYQGLKTIFKGLWDNYHLRIFINGGDTFVQKAIAQKETKLLNIYAVNQETVFSAINFQKGTFGKQSKEDTAYFKEYLQLCKKKGLKVFLTEYVKRDQTLKGDIIEYCRKQGYGYYISNNLELK